MVVLVLGLVQGLAEFLPISSSGHLILVRALFGIQGDYLLFDIALHMGTLFAVCLFFCKDLLQICKPPFGTVGKLVLATIPAVLVGVLSKNFFAPLFAGPKYLWIFFLLTACLLVLTDWIAKKHTTPRLQVSTKDAICMGLVQGLAILPGVSRSGSTIAAGVAMGTERSTVAKFSFLMSIPIIVGSLVLQLAEGVTNEMDWSYIFLGALVSFGSGYLAIKAMMRVIQKAKLWYFAIYLLVLSIAVFFVYFV
ncbi:MAG: undecaprenyl-diphosphate phosphatase [Firmicutes bacterium]|nr:undecaprenyl-diphosphate phosphatase [Bacillota bacterium]